MPTVQLKTAVEEYVTHSRARGLAESTVEGRKSALAMFTRVTGDKAVARVTPADVDKVFARHEWAQGTVNNRVAQYRSFFAWCRARGYAPRDLDPMFGWRSVNTGKTPHQRIPRDEWPMLFGACRNTSETTIVALGLFLFLRVSEMKGIQVQHVHLSEAEIEIHRVKTKEWDTMPIPSELDGVLRRQLEWLSNATLIRGDYYLLPGYLKPKEKDSLGHFLEGSGIMTPERPFRDPRKVVQRILTRCGYPVAREGGHTLRRSGARAYFDVLAEAGYDGALRRVQSMLGHKSSTMTEVYLGLDLDRRRRNDDLRGRPMFPSYDDVNVHVLRGGSRA